MVNDYRPPGVAGFSQVQIMPRGGVPGVPDIQGALDIMGFILDIFGFSFPTHRPDPEELPDGTQWFNQTPEAGIVRFWTQDGGKPYYRWKGEILATAESNFPLGVWDFERQTFDPILMIDSNGCCYFQDEENWNRIVGAPESLAWLQAVANGNHPAGLKVEHTWAQIGEMQSPRDQYPNKYIAEEVRGMSWQAMGADALRFLEQSEAHGVPIFPDEWKGPGTVTGELSNFFDRPIVKTAGKILGGAAAVIAIMRGRGQ